MGILEDIENIFSADNSDGYNSYKNKIIRAQEQWNKDRDWIYKAEGQENYKTEFAGDLQPRTLTTPDNFDNMDLATMQKSVDAMSPSTVDAAVTAWANIGATLTGTFAQFQQEFQRTIDGQGQHSGWRGAAASAAVDAVKNYSTKSTNLANAATLISLKLSEMKTGLEETRTLMPGVTSPQTPAGKTLPTDGIMKVNDHNKDEATQEARRILNTVYGPVAVQTDTGIPYLPQAPEIAATGPASAVSGPSDPAPSGPTPHAATGPRSATGPAASGPATTGASGPAAPGASGPGSDNSQGGASGPSQSSGQQYSGTGTSTNPSAATGSQSTTTAGYSPTGSHYTTSPDASGYSETGLESANSPTYSGSGGSGGTTSATPGRSVAGTAGSAQTAAAAQRGATTAGRSGVAGMGGLGAAAGKGRSEDSEKSGSPDYLVTKEHGEELTGLDEDRKYVPPVIGGDYDAPKY